MHAFEGKSYDAIAAELATFADAGTVGASDFEGHRTRRTGAPLPRSATSPSPATPVRIAFFKGPDGELIELFDNEAT